jgi:hypothetical protein
MTLWSPLVYGRTLEVDFRFLAVPEDFTRDDRTWAERFIMAAIRAPEQLTKGPRWVLFKGRRHGVVGVACMADDLLGLGSPDAVEISCDSQGRALYLFAGYVARLGDNPRPGLPAYTPSLDIFRPLYDVVRRHWRERSFEIDRHPVVPYDRVEVLDQATPVAAALSDVHLNLDDRQIALWPESDRSTLWQAAAGAMDPVSVCLGLPDSREAMASSFLNGTLRGSDDYVIFPHPTDSSPQADEPTRLAQPETAGSVPWRTILIRAVRHLLDPSPFKVAGGVVGGVSGVLVGGRTLLAFGTGFTGLVIGWSIGSVIAVGWHAWRKAQTSQCLGRSTPDPSDSRFGLRQPDADRLKDNNRNWFTES